MKHTLKTTTFLSLLAFLLSGCNFLGSRVGSTEISHATSQPTSSSISEPTSSTFSSESKTSESSVESSTKDSSISSVTSETSKPTSDSTTSSSQPTSQTSVPTSESTSSSSSSIIPPSTSESTATSVQPTSESTSQTTVVPTSQSTSESTAIPTESSSSTGISTTTEVPSTSESTTIIPPTSSTTIPTSTGTSTTHTPSTSTTSHTTTSQPTSTTTIPQPTSESTSQSGIVSISVSQAITIINGLTKNVPTTERYYVEGYITSSVTTGTSGDLKFNIGDTKTSSTTITVYYASSSIGTPSKGDLVVVYGQLEMYNTTKEVVNGSIVSINSSGSSTSSGTSSTSTGTSSTTSQSSSSSSHSTGTTSQPDIPTGDIPDGYYATITESMSGSSLQSALKSIINTSSVSVSYDWSRFEACDQDPDNSSNVLMVYARTSVSKSSHVSGSTGWNREHSFPQSKMETSQAKSDNHVIFASDNKVNGARSNYRLGDLSSQSPNVKDGYGNSTPCKLYDKSGEKFFDPGNTPARGEVARATLYSAVMYDYTITDNFESIALCLEWALSYPVTNRDVYRNDTVYKNQKNRNPFVDHPEYACRIWGTSNSDTRKVCGM